MAITKFDISSLTYEEIETWVEKIKHSRTSTAYYLAEKTVDGDCIRECILTRGDRRYRIEQWLTEGTIMVKITGYIGVIDNFNGRNTQIIYDVNGSDAKLYDADNDTIAEVRVAKAGRSKFEVRPYGYIRSDVRGLNILNNNVPPVMVEAIDFNGEVATTNICNTVLVHDGDKVEHWTVERAALWRQDGKLYICKNCKEGFVSDELHTFCPDCIETLSAECKIVKCDHCGEWVWSDTSYQIDGKCLCQNCLDALYTRCDNCASLTPYTEMREVYGEYNNVISVCEHCYSTSYAPCCHCGHLVHNATLERNDGLCSACFEELNSVIHPYNFVPSEFNFIDITGSKKYFGTELEIDGGGELVKNATDIIADMTDSMYVMHDGSLEDGLEIVTQPCNDIDTIIGKLSVVSKRALKLGYTSHNSGTCGFHVHVSKDAFGENEEIQERNISNLVYMVDYVWDDLIRFSRRSKAAARRWCRNVLTDSAYTDNKSKKEYAKSYAKSPRDWNRYCAINCQNKKTVEFRIFRGSLKPQTLKATLQLVDMLVDLCQTMDDTTIDQFTWQDLIDLATKRGYEAFLTYKRTFTLTSDRDECDQD